MRLLIVFHDSILSSGATRSMVDLIQGWKNNKKELELVCLFPDNGSAVDYLRKLNIKIYIKKYYLNRIENNSKHQYLEKIKCIIKNILSKISLFKLNFEMKKENFDYIYSNTGSIYVGYYISKYLNVPHVWHIREFGILDQNRIQYNGLKKYVSYLNKSNLIIAISKSIFEYLKSIGVDSEKIKILYDDVHVVQITDKRIFDKKTFNFLSCGGIQANKGHMIAINAIEELIKEGLNVKLYIAGDNNNEYGKLLRQYIIDHNLSNNVILTGFVENMLKLRKECDYAIIASHCEAFGRVTIEAMASRMIVFGANAGATPEIVKDGINGFLFESKSYKSLADKIVSVIRNKELLETICENAFIFSNQYLLSNCSDGVYKLLSNRRG